MMILPQLVVNNGENLTLQCTVDISTNLQVQPQHLMLFYKDDVLFYNVTTTESTEIFFIPQARVYDAGMYKCRVILDNKKERTTSEYQVWVKGESSEWNLVPAGGTSLLLNKMAARTHLPSGLAPHSSA